MAFGFQLSAFQDVGFQNSDGGGGQPQPPAAPAGPTPAGRGSSGRHETRRRYVLPDGRMVTATESEISYLLRKFLVTEETKITPRSGGRRYKKSVIRTPVVIEDADIEWRRLMDTQEPVYAPVLPRGIVWSPSPEDLQSALAALTARKRAEDEYAAVILLLH